MCIGVVVKHTECAIAAIHICAIGTIVCCSEKSLLMGRPHGVASYAVAHLLHPLVSLVLLGLLALHHDTRNTRLVLGVRL